MASGFILLYRQILDNPAWAESAHERSDFEALIWILCRAAYEYRVHQTRWGGVPLQKGEVLLSHSLCREVFHWKSTQKARRFLDRLQRQGTLEKVREAGNAGTVYRLPKYAEAQKGRTARMPTDPALGMGRLAGTPVDKPTDRPSSRNGAGSHRGRAGLPSLDAAPSGASEEGSEGTKTYPPPSPAGGREGESQECSLAGAGATPNPSNEAGLCPTSTRYPKPSDGLMAYPEAFNIWWEAYPRRMGPNPRRGGYGRWRKLVASGVGEADLLRAAQEYSAEVRRRGREDSRYVMKASTFLGPEGAWEQYLTTESEDRGPPARPVYPWEEAPHTNHAGHYDKELSHEYDEHEER